MNKLTKKDKAMIYLLIIVIVSFGFFKLLLMPQANKSTELDAAISELEMEKLPMEAGIMSYEGIKKGCETAKEKYEDSVAVFYKYMENYQIDRLMTNMFTSGGLTVKSVTMNSEPVGVMVKKYFIVEQREEAAKTAEEKAAESASSQNGKINSDLIPVLTTNIIITATGTRADINKIIDTLFKDYPSIRVTSYKIVDSNPDISDFEIKCDLYMRSKD